MKEKFLWMTAFVFLASAFLMSYGGAGGCLAAQENKAAQAGGQKKVFDAHDTGVRFHSMGGIEGYPAPL